MRNSHVSRGFEQGTNSGLDQLGDLVAEMAARQGGIKKIASGASARDPVFVGVQPLRLTTT